MDQYCSGKCTPASNDARQRREFGHGRTQVGLEISAPEIVQARNCPNRRVGPCLPVMKIADRFNVGVGTAGFVSSSHLVRRLGRNSIGAGTAASTATRDVRFLVHGCLHWEGKPFWLLLQRMIGTYTVTVPLVVVMLRRTVEKGCDFGHRHCDVSRHWCVKGWGIWRCHPRNLRILLQIKSLAAAVQLHRSLQSVRE